MHDQKSRDMVRSSDRHDLRLPARLQVAEDHEHEVLFSDGLVDQDGWLGITLCNLSNGGLGIESPIFLPRGAVFRVRCEVRVSADGSLAVAGAPAPGVDPERGCSSTTLDLNAVVRRVTMFDPSPCYEAGMSFQDLSEQMRVRVDTCLGHMNRNAAPGADRAGGTGGGA